MFLIFPVQLNFMVKNPYSLGVTLFRASPQKKKGNKFDKNIRANVWQRYNKNSLTGRCYVCKRPITNDNFEVGHNKARAKGGTDHLSNLRPICAPCNHGMGTKSIEGYRAKYFAKKSSVTTRVKSRKRSKRSTNPFGIRPIGFGL
jgi:5-methylcytosine-specific restriction endonuclease McrA